MNDANRLDWKIKARASPPSLAAGGCVRRRRAARGNPLSEFPYWEDNQPVYEIFAEPVGIFLIIIAVVLITPLLSEQVRLPGIVGIILGGMLIGEHGFQLLHEGSEIEFLAAIGLLYLMLTAGMEVDLEQFNRVKGRAAVFGAITFLCP
jgi:hypothetical protein